jgi:hypothetical protein
MWVVYPNRAIYSDWLQTRYAQSLDHLGEGLSRRSDLPVYPFAFVLLILPVLLRHRLWRGGKTSQRHRNHPEHRGPQLLVGLTRQLAGEACVPGVASDPQAPQRLHPI